MYPTTIRQTCRENIIKHDLKLWTCLLDLLSISASICSNRSKLVSFLYSDFKLLRLFIEFIRLATELDSLLVNRLNDLILKS